MRRNAKTDANHTDLAAAFRAAGCSVLSLHQVGAGCPDLLVARNGVSAMVEIKDGAKPPSRRKLRASQEDFRASWKGKVYVAIGIDDVADICASMICDGL